MTKAKNWWSVWTPIHYYAAHGYMGDIRRMLLLGYDMNSCDERGMTPLDIAKREKQESVVAFIKKFNETTRPI